MRNFRSLVLLGCLCAGGARVAIGQNLLANPNFDRSLGGWIGSVVTQSGGTGHVGWIPDDAEQAVSSGALSITAFADSHQSATALLGQCNGFTETSDVSLGGRVRITNQTHTSVELVATFFPESNCSGTPLKSFGVSAHPSPPFTYYSTESRWLMISGTTSVPGGSRSVRFDVRAFASPGSFLVRAFVEGAVDDVFLVRAEPPVTTWLLPSSARVHGAAGSFFTTDLTIGNPGVDDALVTLKFLGNNQEGTFGQERSFVLAGHRFVTQRDVLDSVFFEKETFGAIRVTSTRPGLAITAETSTPVISGTFGQAVSATATADLITNVPRTLVPIREDGDFRTNVMLANATAVPLQVHLELFAPDGSKQGELDVSLSPLEMKQLNRIANALTSSAVPTGMLLLSTPTPNGAFAAYASIIDVTTNDPRTVLPR